MNARTNAATAGNPNDRPLDPRQSDLIDLSVRLLSPLVVLWIRPFGVMPEGFWPTLALALLVSFVAAGGLWLYAERRFDPFHGLVGSQTPDRGGLIVGGVAGLVTLLVVSRVLAVPAAGQRLQWDDPMLGVAVSLVAAVYVAAGLAIWLGSRTVPAAVPGRAGVPEFVDLIRRRADMDALRWLAQEPDDSALAVANQLSRSADPEIRKWIVTNAPQRLGPAAADMLERVASGDTREDVRDRAVDRLVEVAPDRCSAFWPAFRKRLASRDEMDVELAAWKLLAMRDPDLAQEIATVLPSWPASEYIHQSFQVLTLCLERQRDEIVALIKAQDLTLLPWLIKAAFILDDEEIWDAIAQAAERGSDQRAKRHFARALRERYSSALPDLED